MYFNVGIWNGKKGTKSAINNVKLFVTGDACHHYTAIKAAVVKLYPGFQVTRYAPTFREEDPKHLPAPNAFGIHTIIVVKAEDAPETASNVGPVFEGWINDATAARNYFTMKFHPKMGWLTNLGTGWNKKLKNDTLAELLRLPPPRHIVQG